MRTRTGLSDRLAEPGGHAGAVAAHSFARRLARPPRPAPLPDWGLLGPAAGRAWVDLLPRDAPDGLRVLYAMLDAGMLEAWRDQAGHVRLRAPDPPLRRDG